MAKLNTTDKAILEKLFHMESGYVLNFTNSSFENFFRDDLGVNVYSKKYEYRSSSKANRLRAFWVKETDELVAKSIIKMINYIETQILIDELDRNNFPHDRMQAAKEIAERLSGESLEENQSKSQASYQNGNIKITLQDDIFDHVQKLLNDGHYFNAVEESYKIVRKKIKEVTGKEKATDAFNADNYELIFGSLPRNQAEKDFFEGVKFLHMAIQFLRNEKSHTPAGPMDENLALHYISLASLAYDLISRK